ncbi:hypothetical protein SCLCIDRAFT_1208494 [Scleroderma citrinum Foug A]|uniref:Uncharacterized protein n=1 Tax=Scleroderma citrinum Foug A TaxID=1036808 RepID=A0A0C3ELJ9_9AGAM|nr:hypothetical protein SCLCIDRAFT_1208494 [Scleroderma citrinum Foug A]
MAPIPQKCPVIRAFSHERQSADHEPPCHRLLVPQSQHQLRVVAIRNVLAGQTVLANLVNVIVDLGARKSVHGKGSRVRIFVNIGGEETIYLMLDVDSERP